MESPFLDLLKEENLRKLKIDKDLIEEFKIIIYKIDEFFQQNNLMNIRDWKTFFERYLLSPTEEQVSIGFEEYDDVSLGGCYEKQKYSITVNDNNANSLCHEFIHFLVMHDSNSLERKVSDCRFFNEGMTEYLTGCIMGNGNNSLYFREYPMAQFYCNMTKRMNPLELFLMNKYAFKDTMYAPCNIEIYCNYFDNNDNLDAYLNIQHGIIKYSLSDFEINSFDDFVEIVRAINTRPKSDFEYMNDIYERIVESFLNLLGLNDEQYKSLKKQLLDFCKISYKYQLFGNISVADYRIDDIYLGFDADRKSYGDLPINGEKAKGGIFSDRKNIIITHRDKKYKIDREKMKYRKWDTIYMNYYEKLRSVFNYLSNNPICGDSSPQMK